MFLPNEMNTASSNFLNSIKFVDFFESDNPSLILRNISKRNKDTLTSNIPSVSFLRKAMQWFH